MFVRLGVVIFAVALLGLAASLANSPSRTAQAAAPGYISSSHDSLRRLVQANYPSSHAEASGYDSASDRTTRNSSW